MQTEMERLVSERHMKLFRAIRHAVENLPELRLRAKNGKQVVLSCHMLARALAAIFPEDVILEDGWFLKPGMRHSWLRVLWDKGIIIDPYPVALLGGPIMVDAKYVWGPLYISADLAELDGEEFTRHVAIVQDALRAIVKRGLVQ